MYTTLYNKDGTLKHSHECKMAFGKKDAQCPRCAEMLAGAPARDGWQRNYYEKAMREQILEYGTFRQQTKKIQNIRFYK